MPKGPPTPHRSNAPAATPTELMLAVGSIKPGPNPRKQFEHSELRELAVTIAAHGLVYPVAVWQPHPGHYQLIDGERRWRAAQIAGLERIPARVHDVTAQKARELALVANVQRKDLTPMELADGCAALVEEHGYTSERLATEIGKHVNTVRDLIKIARHLPPAARDALAADRIPVSTAALIARIPGRQEREELARFVVCGTTTGKPPTKADVHRAAKRGRAPLTLVEARELIQTRYMRELKTAPFNPEDPNLLRAAGSCTACPKRTGNNRAEYPDSRGDVCTDPACYAEKAQAHARRQPAGIAASATAPCEAAEAEEAEAEEAEAPDEVHRPSPPPRPVAPPAPSVAPRRDTPAANGRPGKSDRRHVEASYPAGLIAGRRWATVATAEDLGQLELVRRQLPADAPPWLRGAIDGALQARNRG